MAKLADTGGHAKIVWAEPERCEKALTPKEAQCDQSKNALALVMLKVALQRGIHFGYIGIDGGYGKEPAFLHNIDSLGCSFVTDVHCDQTIYLQDPAPKIPAWSGRGRHPKHLKAQCGATHVDQWAAAQPAEAWQRLNLRGGEKGALTAEYLHAPAWVWNGTEQQTHRWHLLVRREVGASEISHYCFSNAPLDTSLKELARARASTTLFHRAQFSRSKK